MPPADAETPEHDQAARGSAERITRSLLDHVGTIAEASRAAAIFVYVDALGGRPLPLPENLQTRVFHATKTPREDQEQEERGAAYLRVPNVPLTRQGQAKVAIFLALSRGLVQQGDVIVCLSGLADNGTLDTLSITQVGREFEMYSEGLGSQAQEPHVLPEVLERVVSLASELANEGREGKPVGAMFVLGDADHVLPLTRQLILNPFRGYDEAERNLLSADLRETLKELSTIDGAFVVRGDGVIESCGAYIKVASQEEYELPPGLGARHQAAAAITAVTRATAVTISESTGTVTVFRGGRILVEIEKPRALGQPRSAP